MPVTKGQRGDFVVRQQLILSNLPATRTELAVKIGVHTATIQRHLDWLVSEQRAHVASCGQRGGNNCLVNVYAAGPAPEGLVVRTRKARTKREPAPVPEPELAAYLPRPIPERDPLTAAFYGPAHSSEQLSEKISLTSTQC
jgi:hypothetical protein